MRYPSLLATTAVLTLAAPLAAETPISAKRTTPVSTSNVNNGAADSIRITSAGSVELLSGTAVTIDSNHGVTNEGKIVVTNAAGGVGISTNAGTSGDIVVASTGVITVDETYAPVDGDNDGDLDGPFATGSGRFGIRTLGAHSGKLTNNGTITVEGNDSAGIWLGGPLTGAFTHDGKTTVVGDRSVAVRADAITGNVRLAGTISAQGQGANGAVFAGDVTGAMVVQGSITSTGYRFTTPPANLSRLDADDLLQGGSALVIEGNVSGGIVLAIPPKDNSTTDPDEDRDGIEDAKEGSATLTSFGSAPAMIVGSSTRAITIGAIAGSGTGFGMQIDGTVNGNGLYSGSDGNGLVIGGRGHAVTITGGMGIGGTVSASSVGATATALRIGALAAVPEVRVSGTVAANGGATAGNLATAVRIDAGASVPLLRNTGTIKATAGGTAAGAVAIIDSSGSLVLIENAGAISATGATAGSGRNRAIDLSANTVGVTVRQTVVATGTAPSITGDVLMGSGSDLLDLADGTLAGAVNLGAGNDRLLLSGDAKASGNVLFGAGDDSAALSGTAELSSVLDFSGGGADTLVIGGTSRFNGTLINAGGLAVTVSGGTLDIAGSSTIGSLSVGAGGTLVATLSKTAGAGTLYTVGGTASFANGATLQLKLDSVTNAEGRYVVINAGTLTGAPGITTRTDLIPFLYKASVATGTPANQLAVDIARKSAAELELNTSQGAAYNAVYSALAADAELGGVFLGIRSGDLFRATLDQMLPDHAGATFRMISQGTRTLGRMATDPEGPILLAGKLRIGFQAGAWGGSKARGATQHYKYDGLGAALSAEVDMGLGFVGADLTWIWNENLVNGETQNITSNAYMAGGHWRGTWGGISAFARGGIGKVDFKSKRGFQGAGTSGPINRTMVGNWDGTLTHFAAGISGEGGGKSFFFRPAVQIDYVKLTEKGWSETGGSTAGNMTIGARASKDLSLEGGLTLGVDFSGRASRDTNWMRVEVEGGRRQLLDGEAGATTARYGAGTPFTLQAEEIRSGWYGRLRALGGTSDFQMGGEAGVETGNGRAGFSFRGTLRMPF